MHSHLFTLASALVLAPTALAVNYAFVDLGLAGSDYPSINNNGRVCFTQGNAAVVWHDGTTSLVNMGGGTSGAACINNLNDVGGYFNTNSPSANLNGSPVDLSGFVIIQRGGAVAINDSRAVVVNGFNAQMFVYQNGAHTQVVGDGGIYGTAINNSGVVLGSGQRNGFGGYRAFRWQGGAFQYIAPPTATTDSYIWTYGINDQGMIAGDYTYFGGGSDTPSQPFLYASNGSYTLLPHVADSNLNRPLAINSTNTCVGFLRQNAGGYRAVVWDSSGYTLLNNSLNMPGWIVEEATDINDLGQVVGLASFQGIEHAYLLNPIPAPSTALGLAAFSLFVGGRRRRSS